MDLPFVGTFVLGQLSEHYVLLDRVVRTFVITLLGPHTCLTPGSGSLS